MAGDGTTTATVLAQAIVKEGLRNVAAGANLMSLKRGIERATELAVEAIKNQSKEVDDKAQIANVGAISAADLQIGETIAEAVDKVGKDGVITVEESNTFGQGSTSSRACASTRATSRPTSSPTPSAWKPCSRSRTS